jgi:hypothetical protein
MIPILTPEPHWTAYLTALLTPLVAIIAAYVAWRNVATARNKLKLDLFDRRLKAYDHIQDVISDALKDKANEREAKLSFEQVIRSYGEYEWLFSKDIHNHVKNVTLARLNELRAAYTAKTTPGINDQTKERFGLRYNDAWAAVVEEQGVIHDKLSRYLHLSD